VTCGSRVERRVAPAHVAEIDRQAVARFRVHGEPGAHCRVDCAVGEGDAAICPEALRAATQQKAGAASCCLGSRRRSEAPSRRRTCQKPPLIWGFPYVRPEPVLVK
jgi:hypothetical protein